MPKPIKTVSEALTVALRIIDAQDQLLVAYRTGSSRTPASAIDVLNAQRPRLETYLKGEGHE